MSFKLNISDLQKKKEARENKKIVVEKSIKHDKTGFEAELRLEETDDFNAYYENTFKAGVAGLMRPKTKDEIRAAKYTGQEATYEDYVMDLAGRYILQSWNITTTDGDDLAADSAGFELMMAFAQDDDDVADAMTLLSKGVADVLSEYTQKMNNRAMEVEEVKKKPSRSTRTTKKLAT